MQLFLASDDSALLFGSVYIRTCIFHSEPKEIHFFKDKKGKDTQLKWAHFYHVFLHCNCTLYLWLYTFYHVSSPDFPSFAQFKSFPVHLARNRWPWCLLSCTFFNPDAILSTSQVQNNIIMKFLKTRIPKYVVCTISHNKDKAHT